MLYPASGIDWWFDSYMIVYMFQCHSPKSSHPLLLPQSPKDCSIHLCLFCCLAYRVIFQFSSVQSLSHVHCLQPHELQHARPLCPSPTPGVHTDSRPSSQWCHPAISFSVIPFSSCPQSFIASESFPMSQLFAWGGQSTVVSALVSFLPMNTQDWSPLGWTGWILQSKELSRVFSNTTIQKHSLTLSFL